MRAGTVTHNDTLGIGRGKDMGTHTIAQLLSALYDTPHGVTISIIMPSWMRCVYKRDVERIAAKAGPKCGRCYPLNAEEILAVGKDAAAS